MRGQVVSRVVSMAVFAMLCLGVVPEAGAQLAIGGDPRVNPGDFRVTVFASGLDFPNGIAMLPDGSLLVGSSAPTGGSYFNSTGRLLRFVDANRNGVADAAPTIVANNLPGLISGLRVAGNLVFVISAGGGVERITMLRMAAPAGPYTVQGSLNFAFPSGWIHKSYALAVRPAPGAPAGTWQLFFNVGSDGNNSQSAATVGLSGLLTGTLQGASIYRVTVQDTGSAVTASGLTRIASGLRNAAGMAFHPTTGDFYFQDNGIDGLSDPTEPLSADELNRIIAANVGVGVPNFGFPNDYIQYRTGNRVGSGGVQPIVAFQPVPMPNGSESEGAFNIAFAPPGFPAGLTNGVFVGFHGQSMRGGTSNEENPVVFYDLGTGEYFHFIENLQVGLGHPITLLTTDDSLFVVDLSSSGSLISGGSGVIHRIQRRAPSTAPLTASFTSPAAGAIVSGAVPVGMAAGGVSGPPVRFTLTIDGRQVFDASGTANTASFSWDTRSLPNGAHTLGLTVRDGAGGVATATRNVTVRNGTTGALTTGFTAPAAGATVSGIINVSVFVNGATGVKTFTLAVGGVAIGTQSVTGTTATFSWDTRTVTNGTRTLTISVRDDAGRMGMANRSVTVANGALRAGFSSPAANATVRGTITVGVFATGATGNRTFTLSVGPTVIGTRTVTGTSTTFSWNTTTVANGARTLNVTVRDGTGRTATTSRTVNVAN